MAIKKKNNSLKQTNASIPEEFFERMKSLLGEEEAALLADALEDKPSVSIRLNRKKVTDPYIFMQRFAEYNPKMVPWCSSGFHLEGRPDFVHDPLFHAGTFYVQEAASMYYETLVTEIISTLMAEDGLSAKHPLIVADLCAAPGGKSTAILNALTGNYILVANEFDRKRAFILKENLDKWGDPDVVITNSPVSGFSNFAGVFDIVAVDAPCSGEGMMRREPVARTQWNPGLVEQCATLQREILENAVASLQPGGFLIYSTCTFNEVENEKNVEWLRDTLGLDIFRDPRHFMPHREKCEGLYVCVLRKPLAPEVKKHSVSSLEGMVSLLKKAGINIVSAGTEASVSKGNLQIPSSRRVLAHNFSGEEFPTVELSEDEAVAYLRRNSIVLPEGTPQGFVTVCFEGHPLGLVKNIGNRANNLYPSEWRILS